MVDRSIDSSKSDLADRRLIYVIVFGSAIYSFAYVAVYLYRRSPDFAGLLGDFFAFWTFAKFATAGNADRIYDVAQLSAFQHGLGLGDGTYPYPYPPIFLLLIWPLGLLPYNAALLLWIGTTFALYLAAAIGPNWRARALVILSAPATLVTLIFGQNGFLTAALLVGGFRLASHRPVIAGMLLGLLSYKPTLAAIVPVALIAARLWKALAAACATVAALVGTSIFLFGPGLWRDWFEFLPRFAALLDQQRSSLGHLMPTVTSNLLGFGANPIVAQIAQITVFGGVVVAIYFLFRREQGTLSIAGLLIGALLATPYAFIYDMPVVTMALIFLVEDANRGNFSYGSGERIVYLGTWLLPVLLIPSLPYPIPGSAVLLALLGFVVWHDLRRSQGRG